MIYDHTNCAQNCHVADGMGAELHEVESVDTEALTVVQYEMPLRVLPNNEWARITRNFDRADVVRDSYGRAISITLHGMQP